MWSAFLIGLSKLSEELGVHVIGDWLKDGLYRVRGDRIKITSPANEDWLSDDPDEKFGILSFRVRGTLRRLPKDHRIWLLRQEVGNKDLFPQGFAQTDYEPLTGNWSGRVNGSAISSRTCIWAVVTPPTSCDFFEYFQRVGAKPLSRMPVEIRNSARVIIAGVGKPPTVSP